ncbi:unnamed protein product [Didymodactylos carnosus]|uniref:Uncharacterized protein n=1 Tax=Didymodactylos carnosus TaxID=1234261 RepID=A0A814R1L1_9BILA|nr:unnamed protein product [Didymodactylos carnosus]CAF3891057.1 unnamed protein product [Didymodactylos carnosus]
MIAEVKRKKRRRHNTLALKNENEQLRGTVRKLESENTRLQLLSTSDSNPSPDKNNSKENIPPNSSSRLLFRRLSFGAGKRATLHLIGQKSDLSRDTITQRFEVETGIDIGYSTFTRYAPDFILKPNVDSWGNDTNIRLFIYDKNDIDNVKEQIPTVKTIKRIVSMHELIGEKNGQLYSKDISSDTEKLLKINL